MGIEHEGTGHQEGGEEVCTVALRRPGATTHFVGHTLRAGITPKGEAGFLEPIGRILTAGGRAGTGWSAQHS